MQVGKMGVMAMRVIRIFFWSVSGAPRVIGRREERGPARPSRRRAWHSPPVPATAISSWPQGLWLSRPVVARLSARSSGRIISSIQDGTDSNSGSEQVPRRPNRYHPLSHVHMPHSSDACGSSIARIYPCSVRRPPGTKGRLSRGLGLATVSCS